MFLDYETPAYDPHRKFSSILELAQFVLGFDEIPTNKYMVQNISGILETTNNYAKLISQYILYEEKTEYTFKLSKYSKTIKYDTSTSNINVQHHCEKRLQPVIISIRNFNSVCDLINISMIYSTAEDSDINNGMSIIKSRDYNDSYNHADVKSTIHHTDPRINYYITLFQLLTSPFVDRSAW